MEYCRRRGKGDRGIEWQEPGVVLKDGSVESVGHLGWESSQREQSIQKLSQGSNAWQSYLNIFFFGLY